MTESLVYLHGKPNAKGVIRSTASDFQVNEIIPFQPSGEGEHLMLHIEKTNTNTVFVARQLAKFFDIKENLVTYAGLKDRHAVTTQWFGVHIPGVATPDLSKFVEQDIRILTHARHNKKLKTGALTGNRFAITVKQIEHMPDLLERWQKIVGFGVPNYFGEQRFGIDNNNLRGAIAMFEGRRIKDKKKRGFFLSAARSYLFNLMVQQRIENKLFNTLCVGDVAMLSGTRSVFPVDEVDDTLINRLAEFDINISAPLWGAGELMSGGEVAIYEQQVAEQHPIITAGLAKFGLKQERRNIRLTIIEPEITVDEQEQSATLKFTLPAGCFATTVLRELVDYTDISERIDVTNQ